MKELVYSISDKVFEKFPGYVRGVVVAHGVKNGESPADLVEMLRAAETSARDRLGAKDVTAHPRIGAWREAFRALGIKPADYRSSVEAMARRALRNQALPSISALVDIGNILSLKHLVPVGGHALDEVTADLALRPATTEDRFVPFGSDRPENPVPGEIVFAEGNTVLTRRWTWRQANHTLTLPATTAIEFNVDGLPPLSETEVGEICRELMGVVGQFCGGRMRYEILTRDNPKMRFEGVAKINVEH